MGDRGFPGRPVVKTPPSNAGSMRSIPRLEAKAPHAMGCSQKFKKKKKMNEKLLLPSLNQS